MGWFPPIRISMIFFTWLADFTVFFFFSSRRRHTRLVSDWSSDVCSSDLPPSLGIVFHHSPEDSDRDSPPDVPTARNFLITPTVLSPEETNQQNLSLFSLKVPGAGDRSWDAFWEIGRASCRERWEISVVGV